MTDEKVPFLTIVLVIIFIIIISLTVLSSSYNTNTTTKSTNKKKSVAKRNVKPKFTKEEPVTITQINPSVEYNSLTFNIPNTNKQTGYTINGNFQNSCLSLYVNDARVHSRIFNGDAHIVLASNLQLSNPMFKMSKFKSFLVPLEMEKNYKVVISGVNNAQIQSYTVNYDISLQKIFYEYPLNTGTSEYDLETYSRKIIDNVRERVYPKSTNKYNIFKFTEEGKYAIVYTTNLYNMDININSNIYSSKNSPKTPAVEILYVENPHIEITNYDAKESKKNVHEEYVDFITLPNNLVDKFLYGSSNKNNNLNKINDRVVIYKLSK